MSAPTATIIDYGMGNLRSVQNAVEAVGGQVRFAARPEEVAGSERLILPGVGAFGEAMDRLRQRDLVGALDREVKERGTKLLGICLGMQLLADRGFEHGENTGLGWIAGEVCLLQPQPVMRIPHVGWNVVVARADSQLFREVPAGSTFYFVHSYHLVPKDPEVAAGTAAYGGDFVVAVEHQNVWATQFHPEKSQRAGLQLLRNFLAW
jgi:glutamine amidotransferase